MNYELAKTLKDAGFPQETKYFWFNPFKEQGWRLVKEHEWDFNGHHEWYASPTLEELIEACGDKFYSLFTSDDIFLNKKWFACYINEGKNVTGSIGDTKVEAVAKLWLALNPIQKTENKV
jgi:hypothetical protein